MDENRAAALEQRVKKVEDRVDELYEGLIGDLNNPGALSIVRNTNDTVMVMKKDMDGMKEAAAEYKTDKTVAKKLWLVISALGGSGATGLLMHILSK